MINKLRMLKNELEAKMSKVIVKKEYLKGIMLISLEYDANKQIKFQVTEWLKNKVFVEEFENILKDYLVTENDSITTNEFNVLLEDFIGNKEFKEEYKSIEEALDNALKDIEGMYSDETVDKIKEDLVNISNQARKSGASLLKAFSEAIAPKESSPKDDNKDS